MTLVASQRSSATRVARETGVRLLERVRKDLEVHAIIEQFPRLEGRQMVMVLAPKKKVVPVKAAKKPAGEKAEKTPKAEKAPKAPKEAKQEETKPATAG